MSLLFQGFQQHDVQELSRILFGALESSLLGTPGEALIKNLYHGTSVTKVHNLRSNSLVYNSSLFQDHTCTSFQTELAFRNNNLI